MSFTSPALARSRWSDVYIASIAQFFGATGTFLVLVSLVLALQQRGASGIEVSILVICEALPMVVLGKLIGRLIDRYDSRLLLIVSGVGQMLACLALAQAEQFTAVIAGAVALSVVSGVAVPTRQALLPAMVVRDDLPKASAIGQTAGTAGMMAGPALAGFMVGGLGVRQTLMLAVLGFAATILAGLLLKTRRGGLAAAPAGDADPEPEWTLGSDRLLWSSAWGLTAVMAALSAVNVVLVFFMMRTLGSSEEVYGLIDTTWTIGMLAGAWIFGRAIRPTTVDTTLARLLFVLLGVVSLAMIGVASVQTALWIVPCYLIGGTQNGGLNVLMGTLMGRRVPQEARGRANAALGMRVQAGALVGYVLGGLSLEITDARWSVLACGVLGLFTALAVAPHVLRAGRLTNHDRTGATAQSGAYSVP
ncbi:MFS transporter [Rhizocola hellebori]|uniref:MFS transporter n=1 Tax=Rhizocola hellebori TaxID=1392758 RepID=A0A8J3VKX7_9ACTN|nr:MFS transporter [Rhizocola hellebori]GIH10002.1 MFS transporter [Rhizocola hellebori]